MTMTDWDGTPWAGTIPTSRSLVVTEPQVIKAAVGPGVGFIGPGTSMLSDLSRSPQKLMARAQQAYRRHPWVGSAEAVVTRKMSKLPWHLENEDADVVERGKDEPAAFREVRTMLEHPIIGGRRVGWVDFAALLCRHVGLCGMGFTYLDQRNALNGSPLGLIYVNPRRVWSSENSQGALTGWVLDAQDDYGRGGIPFSTDELIPFYLDQPDEGQYGIGIYERMMGLARVSELTDTHATYVLGTGGRIAGIIGPKEGVIPDEKFLALVREMRVVNDSPDAAKRTTVMQNPVEFIPTAATPNELDFTELAKLSRDDIFAGWGVPLSQAPVNAAVGLNSGDTKGWDEAVLMQGAVHDRVITIRDTLQGIIDLWGAGIRFIIEEPEFDDDTPAYDRAAKSTVIAMTRNERRDIVGLTPLPDYDTNGEPLGVAIDLAGSVSEVAEGPDQNGNLAKREPKPEPPATPAGTDPSLPQPGVPMVGKAGNEKLMGLRVQTQTRWVPRIANSVEEVLGAYRAYVIERVRNASPEVLARHRSDPEYWLPKSKDRDLLAVLLPQEQALADGVMDKVSAVLRKSKADFVTDVLAYIAARVGERVKGITDTTRQLIVDAIGQGFADGLSPLQVAEGLSDSAAFSIARADMIARTESMFAYNDAAIGTYREFGVERVQAIDGDQDELCAARDGQVFTLADAQDELDHPNGTLDWVPVLEEKARIDPTLELVAQMVEAVKASVEKQPVYVSVTNGETKDYRTVVDRDPITGKVTGSHRVPVDV